MSISAVSQHPVTSSQVSSQNTSNDDEHIVIQPRNFLFLVPVVTAVALGSFFLPYFGLGLAVGAGELVCTIIGFTILDRSGVLPRTEEKKSKYQEMIRSALLSVSVFGPIAEEGVFRGIVQPLLAHSIQILVPAAAAAIFGPSLCIAVVVSVVATSVLFGAAHYFNPHKNAHIQAISSTVAGLVYGLLSAQFGIGAAIAAHIANNSIISCAVALQPENKKVDVSVLPA